MDKSDFNLSHPIKSIETIYVRIIVKSSIKQRCLFGFTLINDDDVAVLSSTICEFNTFGKTKLTFECPISILKAGFYKLEGALWKENGIILDQNYQFISFEIMKSMDSSSFSSDFKGFVQIKSNWVITDEI